MPTFGTVITKKYSLRMTGASLHEKYNRILHEHSSVKKYTLCITTTRAHLRFSELLTHAHSFSWSHSYCHGFITIHEIYLNITSVARVLSVCCNDVESFVTNAQLIETGLGCVSDRGRLARMGLCQTLFYWCCWYPNRKVRNMSGMTVWSWGMVFWKI